MLSTDACVGIASQTFISDLPTRSPQSNFNFIRGFSAY
jgi:hypothetical protein